MAETDLQKVRDHAADLLLGGLNRKELFWLVAPNEHIMLLNARRAGMIVSRVRLVAGLFALLTPLWALLDFLMFVPELARALAFGRGAATLAFLAILYFFRDAHQMSSARRALLLLFAIPTLFYLYSAIHFEQYHLSGLAQALAATHTFLPFIVGAGLSIFPLTVLEAALLALPVLVAKAGAGMLNWPPGDLPQIFGAFWLLLLLTAVATLASTSQLAFIIVLVRHAIRDPLTGAFSRQSGMELLDLQFTISERSGTPLSVAFLDLDHFKRVNDEFGHEVGDMVLLNAANRIATLLRTGDILVRWGGEEFIIILPNTDAAQALTGLERLREAGLGTRPNLAPVTASIGLVERVADAVGDWQALVALADSRMYQAKQAGRDRVVAADGAGPAQG